MDETVISILRKREEELIGLVEDEENAQELISLLEKEMKTINHGSKTETLTKLLEESAHKIEQAQLKIDNYIKPQITAKENEIAKLKIDLDVSEKMDQANKIADEANILAKDANSKSRIANIIAIASAIISLTPHALRFINHLNKMQSAG